MPNLPNVLLIMTDQQKATASHLYGNSFCGTPQMARLAKQGVLFEHAFTPHPLCAPARISLWTGQYPHAHGGRRNQTLMPAGVQHAARIWKQLGYHVGLIGKNHCFEHADDLALFDTWCEIGHGGIPDDSETRGMSWVRPVEAIREAHRLRDPEGSPMTPQNPRFSYAVSDAPLEDQSTGLIAAQTVRFLEERQSQPFALWVSFPDPHEPWVAPRRYAEMFPNERIELPPWRPGEFDDPRAPERNRVLARMVGVRDDDIDDVYGLMAVYYGMVRFLDDGLGTILDALERLGLRKNTIVIFCSDHGDFMGEHGMQCKGGVFYDCLTRVPLIVSWPGQIPEGVRDRSMANLIDVVPTLLQLQSQPIPGAMQGLPLPTVTNSPPRDVTFSEYGAGGPPFRMVDLERLAQPFGRKTLLDTLQWREAEGRRKMVRTKDWKYVHDPMGDKDELYDLVADPWELENVADDPAYALVLASLRMRLADWAIGTEDSRAVEMPAPEHYSP